MSWPITLLLALVALVALDRLFRWMEARGWIFYRVRRPSGSGAREVIVARAERRAPRDDDGGPDGKRRRR